ncbi:flagellar biosynthetic protein FliO [Fusibacter sp. JL216-2]|uniref:flagellar biosynthetic protein FliO n=1 Tax=Fusibacter sp. JL216-2 TaxID=3071453 RepID=UPI003D33124B
MKQVSFPLYTLLKAGPDSAIDNLTTGSIINSALFFLVLFLVYFIIRRATNAGQKNLFSKHMRIVEKMPMGLDRSITIVEVKGTYYILCIDKNGTTLLDKRSDLDFDMTQSQVNFNDVFSKWMPKKDREQDETDDE